MYVCIITITHSHNKHRQVTLCICNHPLVGNICTTYVSGVNDIRYVNVLIIRFVKTVNIM